MYEFMKETVIMTAFIVIVGLNVYAYGYWIWRFVKWVRKKVRQEEAESK